MKKMLLILAVACMFSCSDDEQQQDCNCDRVTEANTFNIVGTPQSPAMNYYTVYTTRNECSGEIKQKTYTTTVSTSSPKVGQCR